MTQFLYLELINLYEHFIFCIYLFFFIEIQLKEMCFKILFKLANITTFFNVIRKTIPQLYTTDKYIKSTTFGFPALHFELIFTSKMISY